MWLGETNQNFSECRVAYIVSTNSNYSLILCDTSILDTAILLITVLLGRQEEP